MRTGRISAGVTLVNACMLVALAASPCIAQDDDGGPPAGRQTGPARPTPRWPDGTVNLGAPPGEKGNWDGGGLLATNPKNYEVLLGRKVRPVRCTSRTCRCSSGRARCSTNATPSSSPTSRIRAASRRPVRDRLRRPTASSC